MPKMEHLDRSECTTLLSARRFGRLAVGAPGQPPVKITNPFELKRLATAPLDPWAPGEKPHWLRIRAGAITGRRIVDPEAFAVRSVVSRGGPVVPPG